MKNDFEKLIIKTLFSNADVCSKILPSLKEYWFSDIDCKIIVQEIVDFNGKFGRMPNVLEMKQLLYNSNNEATEEIFKECLDIPDEEANTEFLLGEIEEFVRKKLCYNASNEIVKYVTQGIHPTYSFADALSDAETFSFDTNIGFTVFGDLKRLYEDANTKENILKTRTPYH